ncbi:hypothetical protein E5676_scaffold11G001070 [Cucumis melo var. makuwa]|uniref:Uncharacterized protein n=1 Tax=Cucumis melo var. makuwa TaxID=1194695 RepID=A0A5A7US28_CUCMM|nr:hypothetical protein E6C27_scaffold186G00040 [Cucumis melo var. makuwa]TYK03195.1 hypothetical protein E5676_scaffold11G001070 [Cucumis melo var. makuwa]
MPSAHPEPLSSVRSSPHRSVVDRLCYYVKPSIVDCRRSPRTRTRATLCIAGSPNILYSRAARPSRTPLPRAELSPTTTLFKTRARSFSKPSPHVRPVREPRPVILGVPLGSPKTRHVPTGSQIAHVQEDAYLGAEVEVRAEGSWRMTRSDRGEP